MTEAEGPGAAGGVRHSALGWLALHLLRNGLGLGAEPAQMPVSWSQTRLWPAPLCSGTAETENARLGEELPATGFAGALHGQSGLRKPQAPGRRTEAQRGAASAPASL